LFLEESKNADKNAESTSEYPHGLPDNLNVPVDVTEHLIVHSQEKFVPVFRKIILLSSRWLCHDDTSSIGS